MDWLSGLHKGLIVAQEAAQDAAERAKVMATQASLQVGIFAEQAAEQAKVLARQAGDQAQSQFKLLRATGPSSSQVAEMDLPYFGITEEVLQRVSSMSYSTFSDSPMKAKSSLASSDFKLSPWQEKHVMLVLARAEQLQHLRFALCPKRMNEQLFWTIYFASVKDLLPDQASSLPAGPPTTSLPSTAPETSEGLDSGWGATSSSWHRSGGSAAAGQPAATSSNPSCLAQSSQRPDAQAGGESTSAARMEPAASAEGGDLDIGFTDSNDDDLDQLADLEDDPELDAYLQEAMALEDEAACDMGSDDLGSEAEDLDDYIKSLKDEEDDGA